MASAARPPSVAATANAPAAARTDGSGRSSGHAAERVIERRTERKAPVDVPEVRGQWPVAAGHPGDRSDDRSTASQLGGHDLEERGERGRGTALASIGCKPQRDRAGRSHDHARG